MPAHSVRRAPRNPSDIAQRRRRAAEQSGNFIRRAAAVLPGTVNTESRSINAVIATEAPVPTYDMRTGQIIEEILVVAGGRLPTWAPLLRAHERYYLEASLGSTLDVARKDARITGRLQFGTSADIEPIWERVRDGHIRSVSIGARRLKFHDIAAGQSASVAGRRWTAGRRPLRITTDWAMFECSVVIFGGDPSAMTQ